MILKNIGLNIVTDSVARLHALRTQQQETKEQHKANNSSEMRD